MVGESTLTISLSENPTVKDLKNHLHANYPDTQKLKSLVIAINENYADDSAELSDTDQVAIIPPVSGG